MSLLTLLLVSPLACFNMSNPEEDTQLEDEERF
jgi:hypothetical protein